MAAGHTVVVGAGPCGLALALALAREGLPVSLVESRSRLGTGFRGEALMPSGLEALRRLGLLPLAQNVRQRPLRGWSFWLEQRPLFGVAEAGESARSCTLIDHPDLLENWGEQLCRLDNARLLTGTPVSGLLMEPEAGDDSRVAGVRLANGSGLPADLVVGCDGRASSLRRLAGLSLAEDDQPIDVLWFHLAGTAAEALAERLAGRFHTLIGGAGALALFASSRGDVQLGWPLPRGQRPERTTAEWRRLWLELCPAELAEAVAAVPLASIDGPQRFPVRVGLAERWWRPGLLLLGDAAHPMSPLRAQGSAMALRDAAIAAARLPAALRQPAGPARRAGLDAAMAAIAARRIPEIRRLQALQQQEWQRGERLGHAPLLRRLLATVAPGLGPVFAALWARSQVELRQGVSGALEPEPPPAAMMDHPAAAR